LLGSQGREQLPFEAQSGSIVPGPPGLPGLPGTVGVPGVLGAPGLSGVPGLAGFWVSGVSVPGVPGIEGAPGISVPGGVSTGAVDVGSSELTPLFPVNFALLHAKEKLKKLIKAKDNGNLNSFIVHLSKKQQQQQQQVNFATSVRR